MARLLVILNPVAGRGRGAHVAALIENTLSSHGHAVKLVPTERKGQARELARGDLAHWSDGIVSAGGDGTLNEVINGRADLPLPVGIVPLGTGNVLAKELGIGKQLPAALEPVCKWNLRLIDLAELSDGRRWTCMLSAGIEGRIIELMEQRRKGGAMRMAEYVPMAAKALSDSDYRSIAVEIDGTPVAQSISYAVVANTHSFGGPIEIASQARCDDGLLDVVTAERSIRQSYATMISLAFFKQLTRLAGVRSRRARTIRLSSANGRPVPFQIDGEFAGHLPVEMRVLPSALSVFAPLTHPRDEEHRA